MAHRARNSAQYKSKSGTIPKRKIPLSLLNIGFNEPSTSRNNRFDALADQNDMDTNCESNIASEERQPKPPPIVTDVAVPLKEIQHILGNDCIYKRTSIGTKVFPLNNEKFQFCKNALLENKIEFHTFNSKANRLFTTFIYGLPKIKPQDIIDELKSYNLNPTSVTEITTRFSSANDAVYKVQFTRNTFNPSALRNIKSISNVIITWKKHKPKKNDKPTQCWNCLMYGHGGEHCNRKTACMICASHHNTNQCPFNKNDRRPAAFSCFNCIKHGNERTDHSANDLNCPLRAQYLEARARASSKQPVRTARRQNTHVVSDSEHKNANRNPSYSVGQNNRLSYSDQVKRNNHDLFDIDELFQIFTSALDDLSKCTTKVQQIQVVMSMVKYAYDFK